jgi:hypothetical protein
MKQEELISKFDFQCSCGCGELQFSQWKDDGLAFIQYVIPVLYANEYNNSWKNRFKIIWNVFMGKHHCFYEIVIEDNETLRRFKQFVAGMKEIDDEGFLGNTERKMG